MSAEPILKIVNTGCGITLQDGGRRGWKKFGLPPGGAMDRKSAENANKLLDNPAGAPVLEILLQGAVVQMLRNSWIAICGGGGKPSVAMGRTVKVAKGERISWAAESHGLWSYLAIEGGVEVPRPFGSASYYARGNVGMAIKAGAVLGHPGHSLYLPGGVAGRLLHWKDQLDLTAVPTVRVWPGPQLSSFSAADQKTFFSADWEVTSQSDRTGYRLKGPVLSPRPVEIISEPVLPGSIQVPENGHPVITMPDGPTVGGYPKFGIVEPADLPYIAQRRPGQPVRFTLIHEL